MPQAATDRVQRQEYARVFDLVQQRLDQDKSVRRSLPGGGIVHIERLLPFLAIYRRARAGADPGTHQLVSTEASFLAATPGPGNAADVVRGVKRISEHLVSAFGNVLLLEVWVRPATHAPVRVSADSTPLPGFRIFHARTQRNLVPLLETLEHELRRSRIMDWRPAVEIAADPRLFPERVRPVYGPATAERLPCLQLGIEVEPVFQNPGRDGVYPVVLRSLRSLLGRALKHLFFEFSRGYTSHRPKTFHSLGRRTVVKHVWTVDTLLDEVSTAFDLLIETNPTNTETLWQRFRKSGFETLLEFRYPPLPIDPVALKRKLYSIPIERIEDPTIGHLLRQKQSELDRQLTLLGDRGTPRFLLGSLQLYGGVEPGLLRTAERILEQVPGKGRGSGSGGGLTAAEFKKRADRELAYYRAAWDGFGASSRFSESVIAGLMVSRGHLLISPRSKTPEDRIDALLQHEVGTHLVTYYNGNAQRFTQLRSGFAGYEELQEGLAVIAEYLVGGMSPARLRVLAARVAGTRMMIDGAGAIECFRLLSRYGFDQRMAFNITVRLYRGGGLTKDAIYLRGLLAMMKYIREGGSLEPLFVGKIAAEHIPLIRELTRRRIIAPPKVMPRYLARPDVQQRLERLRGGLDVLELLH